MLPSSFFAALLALALTLTSCVHRAKPPADSATQLAVGAAPVPQTAARGEKESRAAAFRARLKELLPDPDKATSVERMRVARELVDAFPDQPNGWVYLAYAQMELGDLAAAEATYDTARAAGHSAKDLHDLPQLLDMARNGPSFTSTFVHESTHYVVKSDVDQATCVAASKVLEEAYRSYCRRLAPVAGVETTKFRVFLFASKSEYESYLQVLFDGVPENTGGAYISEYRQLLILNFPELSKTLHSLRHEGFHQYLDLLVADAPAWFGEGMAEYFAFADVFSGEWTEGATHDGYVALLRQQRGSWVALDRLLCFDDEAFFGDRSDIHYALSWLVIHYLRQGPKEARAQFDILWRALLAGRKAEEAMYEAFGADGVAALETAVRDWLLQL